MNRDDLLSYVRRHPLAVQSSVSPAGQPQCALVGVVVNERFELFFDTLTDTRKCANLRVNPRVALVIGSSVEPERTLQLEGEVEEPEAAELAAWKTAYFTVFPDGVERERWPGITYFRVRPTWARFSDYHGGKPVVQEYSAADLQG